MKIHILQHVSFEPAGMITDWAKLHRHFLSYSFLFEKEICWPAPNDMDMLVIMGGVMGVYEEDEYDWMLVEKAFIKNAINAKKKVFGVCLGAQFIAESLGAKVFPHTAKEIGWFEVEKVVPHKLTQKLPQTFTTFHWHGDTFNLPDNAIHLFKTEGCEQQGFVYNDHVAGLQFHMEVKEDLLNGMTENERAELVKDKYVQTEEEVKSLMQQYINQQKKFMYNFLDAFI